MQPPLRARHVRVPRAGPPPCALLAAACAPPAGPGPPDCAPFRPSICLPAQECRYVQHILGAEIGPQPVPDRPLRLALDGRPVPVAGVRGGGPAASTDPLDGPRRRTPRRTRNRRRPP